MKRTKIIYWIITILFVVFMLFSAYGEVTNDPQAVAFIAKMGYPPYLNPFLGVAKILGVIAILVPGFPRLKEWAYAGFIIDLFGATYSFIALKYPVSGWAPMLIFICVAFCSYFLYHKVQRARLSANGN